jgi:hypothetical protein
MVRYRAALAAASVAVIAALAGCQGQSGSTLANSTPTPLSSSDCDLLGGNWTGGSCSFDAGQSPSGSPDSQAPGTSTPPASAPARPAAQHCDGSLWSHVYHAYRLHVVSQCRTVTGVVDAIRWEPDGDTHIDLNVSDKSVLNAVNDSEHHGDLVLEEICAGTVTQSDAIAACSGVSNHATVPSRGDAVTVTGSYVLDADHGWMEIHPVSVLTVTGHPGTNATFGIAAEDDQAPAEAPATRPAAPVSHPSAAAPPASCYPLTNGGKCYEPGEYCRKADAGSYGVAGDGKRIYCTGGRWETA